MRSGWRKRKVHVTGFLDAGSSRGTAHSFLPTPLQTVLVLFGSLSFLQGQLEERREENRKGKCDCERGRSKGGGARINFTFLLFQKFWPILAWAFCRQKNTIKTITSGGPLLRGLRGSQRRTVSTTRRQKIRDGK